MLSICSAGRVAWGLSGHASPQLAKPHHLRQQDTGLAWPTRPFRRLSRPHACSSMAFCCSSTRRACASQWIYAPPLAGLRVQPSLVFRMKPFPGRALKNATSGIRGQYSTKVHSHKQCTLDRQQKESQYKHVSLSNDWCVVCVCFLLNIKCIRIKLI